MLFIFSQCLTNLIPRLSIAHDNVLLLLLMKKVKQSLYFDRYLKILAPGLDVMADDRVGGLGTAGTLTAVNGGDTRVNGNAEAEVIIDV
jgi:hypothetical protein